jgi:hypothetical protein
MKVGIRGDVATRCILNERDLVCIYGFWLGFGACGNGFNLCCGGFGACGEHLQFCGNGLNFCDDGFGACSKDFDFSGNGLGTCSKGF